MVTNEVEKPWSSAHLAWLIDTGTTITTVDGKIAKVFEFQYKDDEDIFSAWAKHFRNHYCLDSIIDVLKPPKLSRRDYLNEVKFPSKSNRLGPGIRAGDFGEILVADYLQYVLNFWVPRLRWSSKVIRDESVKGSDVVGFKYNNTIPSNNDMLFTFQVKTKFSRTSDNRLQDAINDSVKDHIRIGESLNFIKQKYIDKGCMNEAKYIERFQSPTDIPYKKIFGAAAVISNEYYDEDKLSESNCCKIPTSKESYIIHPYRDNLVLLIIKGDKMMSLVHELYRRAADEA